MEDTQKLTSPQVSESEGLDDWRVLLHTLQASFSTGSMAKGVEFAARIGAAADAANHHPDLTITYPRVHVLLTTHDAGGLTTRDVDMARTISAIASELGITAEPTAVTQLEIAIDALDIPAVKPFWEAVLGYDADGDDASVDSYGRAPRSGSNRWMPRARNATASTSTSRFRTMSRRSGSRPRWRRAARSSPTHAPLRSGCSPIPRATRPASAPGKHATERAPSVERAGLRSRFATDRGCCPPCR